VIGSGESFTQLSSPSQSWRLQHWREPLSGRRVE
jgi:hypothetical protein